ncbi:MAG: hypothetical protein HY680_05630 [Chloroflexi bacterium]|nr:hypothetical protein [Chloroflexota bacterium]
MTQEQRSLSQVVPLLIAALVCDVAVADPSTGKQNLIGIFNRINVGRFPAGRAFALYIKLADAEGHYQFDLRFVQVASGTVLARAEGILDAKDRLASQDLSINFPQLPIPEPGRYEFQIWANGMFLGSASIHVAPRS